MKLTDFSIGLPRFSHSGNVLGDGGDLQYRPRREAMEFVHIQVNPSALRRWMLFDLDDPHAWFIPAERGLPDPTYIAVNRANGHAHIAYLLAAPVSFGDTSRGAPITWLADIERAYTRRLGADFAYNAHTTRNPFHGQHETDWQAKIPYRLDELNDSLDPKDKKWAARATETTSTGRNCTVFDTIRKPGYKEVVKIKNRGGTEDELYSYLWRMASGENQNFVTQLCFSELKSIVKSVTEWTWKKYDATKSFAASSARARQRVAARYRTPEFLAARRPWLLPKPLP